uniref:Sema domain-containing protein n=1 Tax=Angiostrongylus cantonensis TaxID=6313 RepID=A0A0K0DAG3_ANGCA
MLAFRGEPRFASFPFRLFHASRDVSCSSPFNSINRLYFAGKFVVISREAFADVAMRGLFRLLIGFFHFHNVLIASSQHFYYSKTTINNVVIDDGKIYVGAVNKLAVLSTEELLPLHSLTTGPINDSVLCSFDGSSCLKNAVLRDTDNHNKVLQVLPDGVLHCGSVRQGICSMHSLRDLSMVSSGDVPVASISPTASCISLVLSPTRLAVAVSYSGDSPYRDPFPAVAVRELPSYLVLNAGSLEGEAAVFLRAELRLSFVVQYLTIFHHAHYVFIAAVQSQNTRQMRSLPRVTKLLRFCDNDTRFISYSEVELQCRSEDNSNFPHMTAAFIHGDYLVGAFTTSPSGTRSAICLFSMQRLKLIFWYNIDRCRGGADSIGLAHIGRDAKCLNKSRLPLDEETCELGVGGSIEAVEIAVAEVTVKITSLNGLGSPRILLAGTDDGQILQASSFPFLILRVLSFKSKSPAQLEEYNRRNVGDGRTGFRVQQLFIRDVAIYAILPRGVNVCPMKNGAPMPASLSIDDLKNISIPINYLPQPDGFSYVCLFGISASAATWTEHGVSCALPSLWMSQMEPLFTELLAVTTSISSHRIVEYNFTVYNCGAFTTSIAIPIGESQEIVFPVAHLDRLPSEQSYSCRVLLNGTAISSKAWFNQFSPSSGPVEGGTEVTIIGRDLGSTMDDVRERVFVAGSRCPVIHYEISRKVVCRVEKGTSAGPLRITVGRTGSRTAESTLIYSFVETLVFSVYPSFAPVSGGTKVSSLQITVYGQNLDAGSNVVVDVGGVPCEDIVRNSSSSFTCIVSHATTPSKLVQIVVSIDAATMSVPNLFEFRPDPIVSSAYPLVTFRSGGRMVTVEGSNFDSVLSARMFFVSSTTPPFEIVSKLSPCQIQNATLMFCFTPELLPEPPFRPSYTRFPLGFAMENVTSVRNLGHRIQMRVVPDPEFVPFKGIRIHQGDQPLILDGSHLNEAAEPQDYKIFIGTERCYVTLVDSRQLVCNGPSTQPEATDDKGDVIVGGLPLVSVTVGRIRVELGLIEYVDPIATLRLWVLVVVALTALSSLLVLLAFLWKKRRLERERDYRKIQMQMEHLESNVRKECKQAFAELQTTMDCCGDDEYEDSGNSRVGVGDVARRKKHAVFPADRRAVTELPVLHGRGVVVAQSSHREKCPRNSNILFRKSDSVVEKMVSKWLTICLYDSISQDQIHKYSTLYKALKYQTEKGPVDAVTGSARYTINESKLLREIVDGSYVDCLVTSFDGSGPFAVRAIACDTISQLKQKILDHIFKRTPHSQRPALFRFDLELLCPSRGRLLLSDWSGSPSIKAPTKLNTLAHYGISNQSHIVMVPNEKNSAHYRDSLADSGKSSWTSLDRCSPMYPPSRFFHLTSPSRTLTMERRKKIDESIPKSIPEVYLTRLLTSKGTVQKYIEDFVESVLFAETSGHSMILKSVFDLLDDEAARNGVSDLQLIQQWKSNLYILRVWVHLIKNPKILLDVSESVSQDGNLSVVAQTLMDCFSFSEQTLGAHSPSSRLLFAKEVARLRPLSSDLFRRIRRQPAITEEAFIERLNEVANVRIFQFFGN